MITDKDLRAWEEDPWLFGSPITGKIDSFKEIRAVCSELLQWRKLGRELIEWNNSPPVDLGLNWPLEEKLRTLLTSIEGKE